MYVHGALYSNLLHSMCWSHTVSRATIHKQLAPPAGSVWLSSRHREISGLLMRSIPSVRLVHGFRRPLTASSIFILFLPLLFSAFANSQQPEPQKQSSPGMGVSTGAAHPAVKDSKSRPITAGGFVDGAPVIFTDVTKQAGLDKFHHRSGTPQKTSIIETPGSGVALFDYDNDGWLDIYLLNGSTIAAFKGKEPAPRAMLFHNNHDGTFTDVTDKAGVSNERWGFGVAVGDYDNDGWPDLYVANYGRNRLYHNNHDGTFTDVAEKAGVTRRRLVHGPDVGRL